MKYIEFDVKNMAISRSSRDKASPVSGSMNYYGVQFNFDDEFSGLAGTKAVEFYKGRNTIRVDLIEGKCQIPNDFLRDKTAFDMRVINGNSVATPWVSVAITESGPIMPEEPGEDAPAGMEYVKTLSGDSAVPFLRASTNGLEFSKDGEEWEGGISGVPEVPKDAKGQPAKKYMRVHGDWVEYEEAETQDLSEYAKTEEIKDGLMTGTAAAVTEITGGEETTTADLIAKLNEIIGILQARGIALSE